MRHYTKGILLLLVVLLLSLGVAHYLRPRIEGFEEGSIEQEPEENVEENATENVPVKLPAQYTPTGLHKTINQMIVNAMQTLSPARRGRMGPPGVPGPPGPSGGITVDNGNVLRHVGSLAVVERLAGSGTTAKVFLTGQTYSPQQTWSMDKKGQIRNHYVGKDSSGPTCLAMDKNGTTIYMTPCIDGTADPPVNQVWTRQGMGGLKSKLLSEKGTDLCLEPKKVSLQAGRLVGDKTTGPVSPVERQYLTATPCDVNNANQVFSFY